MDAFIQKLHPALHLGHRLTLIGSHKPFFSRQGDWNGGCALNCVAMALAMLGKLSDPARLPIHQSGRETAFRDRAWPHYLRGLTPSELVSLNWELNASVRPVCGSGRPGSYSELPRTGVGQRMARHRHLANPASAAVTCRTCYRRGGAAAPARLLTTCAAAARSGWIRTGARCVQRTTGIWQRATVDPRVSRHCCGDGHGHDRWRGIDPHGEATTVVTATGCV